MNVRWVKLSALVFVWLAVVAAAWLWWNRPQRVNMAAYAPADTLVYLEADSLPDILRGLATTDAWQALAPLVGIDSNLDKIGWLSRAAAWTGIGSAQSVVLSRAQIAVAVLNFDAAEESGDALRIKPRVALIAETHTGERRARAVIEEMVGDFVRRAYGQPQIDRKEIGEDIFITWTAPRSGPKINAAMSGSLAVIGNDEATVRECLAVRRGERPSLANDEQLAEMRQHVSADNALAFGYVPPAGARKLVEIAALVYAGRFLSDQKLQSAAAIQLPQLADKILGGAAWSARITNASVEDQYFIAAPDALTARLREALAAAPDPVGNASGFLPADVFQLTRYNLRDPAAAWRSLNAAISTQLDIMLAPLVGKFLDESLKPFGIDSPRDFFAAVGTDITTARLDDTGTSLVLIAAVHDETALRAQVRRRLGGGARTERIGRAEMNVASDPELGAASFVDGYLLMGSAEDVRRCLAARAANHTLTTTGAYKETLRAAPTLAPEGSITTWSNDAESARAFISFVARQRAARNSRADGGALQRALDARPYALSETQLVEGGFEKKTFSSFGQFGAIVMQFASGADHRR